MKISATTLRNDVYKILDSALTGVPIEIERKGRRLRIVVDEESGRLNKLIPHPDYIVGGPDALDEDIDWSNEWQP